MNKDDRNHNVKKEKFIMISTSVMVLTALIVSGAYVRNHNKESMDQGYSIDFSMMENRADEKAREITQFSRSNRMKNEEETIPEKQVQAGPDATKLSEWDGKVEEQASDDQILSKSMSKGTDLAKSATKKEKTEVSKERQTQSISKETGNEGNWEVTEMVRSEVIDEDMPMAVQEVAAVNPIVDDELHFSPDQLVKPVQGATLIEYGMDHSVYFATLDQYKYNPAVIYGATQGESVIACCKGRVMNVRKDAVLGSVLVLDLGDGYQATYGQLEDIEIPIGGIVEAGGKLAKVAAPTKYFSVEGSNLYFELKKDGKSVDPGQFFQ